MAKRWVVDWQNKNPSVVMCLDAAPRKRIVLVDDKAKFAWIEKLEKGDSVWTELGASADILALLCLQRGVDIRRIQTRLLKDWRVERQLDKSDSFASLLHFAENEQDKFYRTPAEVQEVLALRCLVRHFERTQEMRKSEAHRLRGVATMEYFLQPELQMSAMDNAQAERLEGQLMLILGRVQEEVMGILKKEALPKTLLRKIAAQLNARRLSTAIRDEVQSRKRTAKDTDLKIYLERRFAESDIFWGIGLEEEKYAVEIAGQLETMRVWKEVFALIPGMGPKIAGRIVSAIGDIRRFETAFSLACYFGYHVRQDGTCPRREKGIAGAEKRRKMMEEGARAVDFGAWNKIGRQGLYLWCEQVNKATEKNAPALMPFKEAILERKRYVARKHWREAAQEVAGSGEKSRELTDFLAAIDLAGEEWPRSGESLLEDGMNPYLVCCRDPEVVQSPWLLRDCMAELLRKSGEEISDAELSADDSETDEDEARLLASSEEESEDGKPKKVKPQKWQFGVPKMELSAEVKREMRRFMRSYFLSKKRIHLGSYRWLINNVLIRNRIWPLYRKMLGLSTHPDPRYERKYPQGRSRAQESRQEARSNARPVEFTDIAYGAEAE